MVYMFFSHNYGKIKIDLDVNSSLEETLTLHNVSILIKSVFNKNENLYYYNIFLLNCYYQLDKKTTATKNFDSIIMLRFDKTKVANEEFCGTKKEAKN